MKNWIKILPAFLVFAASAQYNAPTTEVQPETPVEINNRWNDPRLEEDLIIPKLTILEYIAPAPKISADVEFRPAQGRMAYQLGAGILPNFSLAAWTVNEPGMGAKLFKNSIGGMARGEMRFYLKQSKVTYLSTGLELDYRFLKAESTLGYEPDPETVSEEFGFWGGVAEFFGLMDNTDYAYFQNQDLNMHRFSSTWGLNVGQARVFRNRFSFEWFVGTRMQLSRVFLVDDLPADAELARVSNPLGWAMNTNGFSMRPSVTTGVRFGFGLKKKSGL